MSHTKKTYNLGKIKQLIDLNGDSTNFDLNFKVTSQDKTPFNLLVVDQTTLDNTPTLEYKEAKGEMSGNIVADKNVFQNYFLILKSDNPCVVEVELEKKELPPTPDIKMENFSSVGNNLLNSDNTRLRSMKIPEKGVNWIKVGLIILVILVGIGLLWFFYSKKTKEVPEKSDMEKSPPTFAYDMFSDLNKNDGNFSKLNIRPSNSLEHKSSIPSPNSLEHKSSIPSPNSLEHKSSSIVVSDSSSQLESNRGSVPSYKPKYTLSRDTVSMQSSGEATLLDRLRKYAN